jgi:hypothetical protein
MKSRSKFAKSAVPLAVLASTLAIVTVGATVPKHVFADNVSHPTLGQSVSQEKIKHVVYIIMDNVHQSDIEQMPAVMKFLHQGTVFTNDHTILDSHTQDGMLSDMTGKYPSHTGVIDQGFYERTATGFAYSSFRYWTNADADGQPHVTTTPNWTAFNQHGWSVGAVGAPDMELESAKEVTPSMMTSSDTNASDYLGIAVHNADGTTTFGSPNLPYLYNAKSWDNSTTLGAFPGWSDGTDLNWSLQATYEMQTHGVPVTFTYLHDAHEIGGKQALPGTYNATLTAYNSALETFFSKLKASGMTPANTLFVLTTDEGDQLMPQGELSTNLTAWLASNSLNQQNASNITVYGDSGALVYLKDNTELSKTLASLTAVPGWNYVANPTELKALHMDVTAAPNRNPSFVLFSKPSVYYSYKGSTDWTYNTNYYWNHGTISPDILDTWAAMVGPGVKVNATSTQWLDHADTMPTIYSLLGYSLTGASFDGVPALSGLNATKPRIHKDDELLQAESVFKQLNAPVGQFGMATLRMSTEASVNATNTVGATLDAKISHLTAERNTAAAALQADILRAVEGKPVSPDQLQMHIAAAKKILNAVATYSSN